MKISQILKGELSSENLLFLNELTNQETALFADFYDTFDKDNLDVLLKHFIKRGRFQPVFNIPFEFYDNMVKLFVEGELTNMIYNKLDTGRPEINLSEFFHELHDLVKQDEFNFRVIAENISKFVENDNNVYENIESFLAWFSANKSQLATKELHKNNIDLWQYSNSKWGDYINECFAKHGIINEDFTQDILDNIDLFELDGNILQTKKNIEGFINWWDLNGNESLDVLNDFNEFKSGDDEEDIEDEYYYYDDEEDIEAEYYDDEEIDFSTNQNGDYKLEIFSGFKNQDDNINALNSKAYFNKDKSLFSLNHRITKQKLTDIDDVNNLIHALEIEVDEYSESEDRLYASMLPLITLKGEDTVFELTEAVNNNSELLTNFLVKINEYYLFGVFDGSECKVAVLTDFTPYPANRVLNQLDEENVFNRVMIFESFVEEHDQYEWDLIKNKVRVDFFDYPSNDKFKRLSGLKHNPNDISFIDMDDVSEVTDRLYISTLPSFNLDGNNYRQFFRDAQNIAEQNEEIDMFLVKFDDKYFVLDSFDISKIRLMGLEYFTPYETNKI